MPTLYLSLSLEAALQEAAQAFPLKLEPLTICTYEVDCDDILDLRSEEGRKSLRVQHSDLSCDWMRERDRGGLPASWEVASCLFDDGAAGILVPSFARGVKADAANLVLWRWGPDLPHRVSVHDPSGRLPADQLSWRR